MTSDLQASPQLSPEPTASSTPALSIDDVCVAYGDVHALDHLTLEIPRGVSVAVIGPNGSGKSTLLKVLAGVMPSTTGRVERHGNDTAIVMQSTEVDRNLPMTVADTVAIGRYPHVGLLRPFGSNNKAVMRSAIERMALTDLADRQIHHLSGGQRQRAFVAQGLAQQAPVLLLDEPMTGLDVQSRSLIAEALRVERAEGRTTLTTTHDFSDAQQSDLVLLIATKCVAFGPPDEVLTEPNLHEAFGGHFVRIGNTLVLDEAVHHTH